MDGVGEVVDVDGAGGGELDGDEVGDRFAGAEVQVRGEGLGDVGGQTVKKLDALGWVAVMVSTTAVAPLGGTKPCPLTWWMRA